MVRPFRHAVFAFSLGAIVVGGGASTGAAMLAGAFEPADAVARGVRVEGQAVPDGADVRAFVTALTDAYLNRRARIVVEGDAGGDAERDGHGDGHVLFEGRFADLGVRVDIDATVARALAVGRVGGLEERIATRMRARRGGVDVPLAPSIDEATFLSALSAGKARLDRAPASARFDFAEDRIVDAREGAFVDTRTALVRFEAALLARADEPSSVVRVSAPNVRVAPRVTRAYLEALDRKTVVATFETFFSRGGDQARRAQNIEAAASKIDGLVLAPGELVSFNGVVGARIEENGFKKSWEIFKGEMVEGVGGGTCQVASTLHAAALFAGLDVVDRLPHSRPSAYIPIGLDATVVYPVVDLKLRNPYPFPVVVRASVVGSKIRIDVLGASKPKSVRFEREVVKTFAFKRKVEEDERLRGFRVVKKQHGIRGFRIKRVRTVELEDGTRRVEETSDLYPQTAEVWSVPRGFDPALLPPLVVDGEGDGEENAGASGVHLASTGGAPGGRTVELTGGRPGGTDDPDVAAAAFGDDASERERAEPRLEIVEARGAHAPTAAQANPPKTVVMKR
jgi:vancomycin resistance protein YoaR